MSDVAIKIENVSKLYRIGTRRSGSLRESLSAGWAGLLGRGKRTPAEEFWALRDVSFEIKRGDAVGIIGKNGAGKSTLLKILSRITEPTRGRIEINGRVASLLEVGTGFHPELSGRENIYLNGTILGMTRREIRAKFDEIVAFSGVEKFIDTPVKYYSSGMYVRLAFAVAAHLEPEILIIDEVLAVGDAEFQKKCLGKMEQVAGQGRTVLFVSHQMGAVSKLCSRGILLQSGSVISNSNSDEVIAAYMNAIVSKDQHTLFINQDNTAKDIFIQSVEPVNEAGVFSGTFTQEDDIFLRLGLIVNRWHDNAIIGLRVNDHSGRNIFTTEYKFRDIQKKSTNKVSVTIRIPGRFLTPNIYRLTLGVHIPNITLLDFHEHIEGFTIIDVGSDFEQYNSSDYGCVFANCEWDIKGA